ncbi:hypothetical protein M404DRAFT_541919 [Pisolithus tinctorius Marx 270]|uniref:Uncharacterized protein n=1 Tax=Pisolithus tinctorius Marx 270 TaxID=870435 RepID=A0A0C3PAJ5_PISTI|nr:hypothetical protein M404DRAFT_541919 [Pisolithus tinctorius Marx 270]
MVRTFLTAECKQYWQFFLAQGLYSAESPSCQLLASYLIGLPRKKGWPLASRLLARRLGEHYSPS